MPAAGEAAAAGPGVNGVAAAGAAGPTAAATARPAATTGPAGLVDAEQRDHHFERTLDADADQHIGADLVAAQPR
ncbi:MAG TPA: hypothetical protein VHN18_16595, partial [Micromonosporaceae bacterium]|nr:hypothetical protein [Micromonosporaceae bacterium]